MGYSYYNVLFCKISILGAARFHGNTVVPSALGVFVVTLLKMLTNTKNKVISKAIRPGMTSGGTTKLIQETTTNRPFLLKVCV